MMVGLGGDRGRLGVLGAWFGRCNASGSNLAGAYSSFNFGLYFEIDGFNIDIIILECGSNNSKVAITELFDIK